MSNSIHLIMDIRNEALHGGEITESDAERIIGIGVEVLGHLYRYGEPSGNAGLAVETQTEGQKS